MTPTPRMQRIRPVSKIVLALGSNLGDREATLDAAVHAISTIPGVTVETVSSYVETPAITLAGVDDDAPRYLNAVLVGSAAGDPEPLLDALNAIEDESGRIRGERWGDRTLDIDIIVFGGAVRDDERLTLPHPRAFERAFVLQPWLEIDPFAVLPGYGPVARLRADARDEVLPYVRSSPVPPVSPAFSGSAGSASAVSDPSVSDPSVSDPSDSDSDTEGPA